MSNTRDIDYSNPDETYFLGREHERNAIILWPSKRYPQIAEDIKNGQHWDKSDPYKSEDV